ncbi:MAG TPA: site-specific integrase [Phycisphaerae bacterium]|jgi:site-specific recombinase XerD|nr:site-specific integrase [Phycisphaerae bacterium]HOB73340.1 site-specific integrase [Phycisphaerae bacterium]HOL24982.1 site-specific integrase [Phycisphaerae bacterium]HPP20084.1 site-specific integrase [Phycisphaerae bacterium]HQA45732.1 site-specific integrase [Phycisphaerae bacterium]
MARAPWEITREMFLSLDEVQSLLAHVRERAQEGGTTAFLDRLIVEAMMFSGLRNSEFCRLRLADALVSEGRPMLRVVETKGEERTVYLPAEPGALIHEYITSVRKELLPPEIHPDDPDGPLVLNERGRPFERTGLYRRVVRILTAAGLGDRASVQLLRHTYGYLAYLRTGGNLLFVQRQLGHAHPMVTSIYAQFVDESYAELAERVFGTGNREAPKPPERKLISAVEEFSSEFD